MAFAMPAQWATGIEKLRTGRGVFAKMARGGLWLAMGSGAENVMRIVRNMILARLIAPEAFGAMALVLAVNGAFDALTEVGVREAVIQNPRGGRRDHLNAAWWMAALRGAGIYATACLVAPWAAEFYHNPALAPMMRVALLSILFNGLFSARAYLALKRMRYRAWMLINQGGSFLGIATAITLGFLIHNIWALAIGFAVEAAGRCLLSYVVCPFRPGFRISREGLQPLLRYARGMVGVPVLTLLYTKSDIFVLGRLRPSGELGLYTLATSLAYIPDTLCAMVFSPVVLPAMASVQHDPERLLTILLRTMRTLGLFFLPGLTLMACWAPQILKLMFGAPYVEVSLAFSLMCLAEAVRVIGWTLITAFFATGRPDLGRYASALRLAVLMVVIVPLVAWYGAAGAAGAALVSSLAWAVLGAVQLRRLFGLTLGKCLGALSDGLILSAAIAGTWAGFELLRPLLGRLLH